MNAMTNPNRATYVQVVGDVVYHVTTRRQSGRFVVHEGSRIVTDRPVKFLDDARYAIAMDAKAMGYDSN